VIRGRKRFTVKPLEHTCECCGALSLIERAGRFRDDDFVELLHDYLDLEREYRTAKARLEHEIDKLRWLLEDRTATADRWQALAEAWRVAYEASETAKYPDEVDAIP
jgi:hypothetical protein